jgi:hypothetical protein
MGSTYYSPDQVPVLGALSLAGTTTDSYSRGKAITDGDIQTIVSSALTSGRLPTDANGIYVVLTSKDVSETSGFCSSFCGWHTYATLNGASIKYSFVGDGDACPSACQSDQGTSPNGDPGADGMASVMAHEILETATDPTLNGWYGNGLGQEVGDLCAWNFGTTYKATNGSNANVHLGGRDYLLQQEWTNIGSGFCGLRLEGQSDLTGDFNGDGYADYVDQTRSSGAFYAHANLKNGTFAPVGQNVASGTACGGGACDALVGDFNGDGYSDYADHDLNSGTFYVHLNQKNGTFTGAGNNYAVATTCAGSDCDVFVADFTGDGYADYADHSASTGQTWIHANLRNGTFAPAGTNWGTPTTCAGSTCNVLVADFTGDGYADYADHDLASGNFWIHANLHNGTFAAAGTNWGTGTTCGNRDCTVLVGDFTGDGYADYADHDTSSGEFWIHENLRNGKFNGAGTNWGTGTTCFGDNCGLLGQ